MYKETAEFIINEITKEKTIVEVAPIEFSVIDYSVNGVTNIVQSSKINKIVLVENNDSERNVYKNYPSHQAELIKLYGTDLFVILHEIGHAKTVIGLSVTAMLKKKQKVSEILDYREQSRAYRNLPAERRADQWAFKWLLKHPKQARYYQEMLELARKG